MSVGPKTAAHPPHLSRGSLLAASPPTPPPPSFRLATFVIARVRGVAVLLLLAHASTSWPCSSGRGMPEASRSAIERGVEAFLGRMGRPTASPLSSPTMQALLSAPARNSTTLHHHKQQGLEIQTELR
jgi:hypothetical protein